MQSCGMAHAYVLSKLTGPDGGIELQKCQTQNVARRMNAPEAGSCVWFTLRIFLVIHLNLVI